MVTESGLNKPSYTCFYGLDQVYRSEPSTCSTAGEEEDFSLEVGKT